MKRLSLILTFLILSIFLLTSCGLNSDGYNSNESPFGLKANASLERPTAGILNYRENYHNLAAITGVPLTNNTIRGFFNQVKNRMSAEGDVKQVSSTMLLAYTGLSGLFCREFINLESRMSANQRRAHLAINFSENLNQLTGPTLDQTIVQYGNLFWQRNPDSYEMGVLRNAVEEAKVNAPNNRNELKNVLLVLCSSVASSLDAISN